MVVNVILNIIFSIASILAAFISAYYAAKSYRNYRFSIMPLLIPENDVEDPEELRIKIKNCGKGPAREIEIIIDALNIKEKINTILLEGQETRYLKKLVFNDGNNPLFGKELKIKFKDLDNNLYTVKATFKKDVNEDRAKKGHIDRLFERIDLEKNREK